METHTHASPIGSRFGQVAWVVPDLRAAERFFLDTMGIPGFVRMEGVRAQDTDGTFRGEPGDFEFHLSLTLVNGTMLELIQPVGGRSIYQDFLDAHPRGGVQHVAYMVPEGELDDQVALLTGKGYTVTQTVTLPVARVAYFETEPVIGVSTEIVGVTPAGFELLAQLERGEYGA